MTGIKNILIENIDTAFILEEFESVKKEVRKLKTHFQPKEPTTYLTRKEVAEMFQITLPTVGEWSKKGILKPNQIGNRIFFKRHEVEAALTEIKPRCHA